MGESGGPFREIGGIEGEGGPGRCRCWKRRPLARLQLAIVRALREKCAPSMLVVLKRVKGHPDEAIVALQ